MASREAFTFLGFVRRGNVTKAHFEVAGATTIPYLFTKSRCERMREELKKEKLPYDAFEEALQTWNTPS